MDFEKVFGTVALDATDLSSTAAGLHVNPVRLYEIIVAHLRVAHFTVAARGRRRRPVRSLIDAAVAAGLAVAGRSAESIQSPVGKRQPHGRFFHRVIPVGHDPVVVLHMSLEEVMIEEISVAAQVSNG